MRALNERVGEFCAVASDLRLDAKAAQEGRPTMRGMPPSVGASFMMWEHLVFCLEVRSGDHTEARSRLKQLSQDLLAATVTGPSALGTAESVLSEMAALMEAAEKQPLHE